MAEAQRGEGRKVDGGKETRKAPVKTRPASERTKVWGVGRRLIQGPSWHLSLTLA